MSTSERIRLETFKRVKRGELSVARAAKLLGVSLRQARRLWKSFQVKGDKGLIHGLRGRTGGVANRSLDDQRQEAVALCRKHYADFGAALAAEQLAANHGLDVGRRTLWRWLSEAGLGGRQRRAVKHRTRRERRACLGELQQMDGSTHDWFEGRGPACVLFVMVDDATNLLHMRFYDSEDTRSAFDLFGRYVGLHGLPRALYVDKDSIYRVNDELACENARQKGKVLLTQFGRAMKSLGVGMIFADSPQAKGRVERMHGTQQDRLIKLMRLAQVSDVAGANRFLDRGYLAKFNAQFQVKAAQQTNVHRSIPRGVILADALSIQEQRVVGKDWCVTYAGRVLQIDKRHVKLSLARKKVTVIDGASGELKLLYTGKPLVYSQIAARPEAAPAQPRTLSDRTPWRPGSSHPWRRSGVKPATAPARG